MIKVYLPYRKGQSFYEHTNDNFEVLQNCIRLSNSDIRTIVNKNTLLGLAT